MFGEVFSGTLDYELSFDSKKYPFGVDVQVVFNYRCPTSEWAPSGKSNWYFNVTKLKYESQGPEAELPERIFWTNGGKGVFNPDPSIDYAKNGYRQEIIMGVNIKFTTIFHHWNYDSVHTGSVDVMTILKSPCKAPHFIKMANGTIRE